MVDFALGVVQFDLLQMQPHFPGYPYFILGGMLFSNFAETPQLALSYFNSFLMLSTIIPIYLFAREYLSKENSLLLTAFVHSISYLIIMGVQPMSEGAAVAVLAWYIWSLKLAIKKNRFSIRLLPLFLFSVLLGIRFSYLLLGVGILFMWWNTIKSAKGGWITVIKESVIAVVFQFLWVSALASNVGGWETFIQIANGFSDGHFNEWGGTSFSENTSTLSRGMTLLFTNVFWTGLFSKSYFLMVIGGFILVYLGFQIIFNRKLFLHPMLLIMMAAYFLWAWFGQNIDKPRHILPLILLACLYMGIWLLKNNKISITMIFIVFLLAQVFIGVNLLKEQYQQTPAVYQLANDLSVADNPFILYTWEETRVFEYIKSPFEHKRILTYTQFLEDITYAKNKQIYITNRVKEGFIAQGAVENDFVKVKSFHSNPLFDPVYASIELYEWKGETVNERKN